MIVLTTHQKIICKKIKSKRDRFKYPRNAQNIPGEHSRVPQRVPFGIWKKWRISSTSWKEKNIKEYRIWKKKWYINTPLVLTPIQLRYLVNFLDINVLPRAGSPTITKHVGTLAVKKKKKRKNYYNVFRRFFFSSNLEILREFFRPKILLVYEPSCT